MIDCSFSADLRLALHPRGTDWYVAERLVATIDQAFAVIVPARTTTDGASIPRAFWRVVGHPFSRSLIYGAVLHDAGYNGRAVVVDLATGCTVTPPREWWDALLRDVLEWSGVGRVRRATIYRAVRTCGGRSWRSRA